MNIESQYLAVLNNLSDGVYFVNKDRKIEYWSKSAEEISGYTANEMTGCCCQNTGLNHIDESGMPLCTSDCPLNKTIKDGEQRKATVYLRHKAGYRVPVNVNIFPLYENNEIIGACEVFTKLSSVTYEDDLITKLSNASMYDQLTGLANRLYTNNFFEYKYNEYKKFNRLFAVLFLDIDNFSSFNNTYGHDMGDAVLRNIAKALKNNMRSSDFIGRWGGEEFLGIYNVDTTEKAKKLAEGVRAVIENTSITCGDNSVNVTASIGITVIKPDDTVDSLIKRADTLMYHSKHSGKNKVTADE